MDTSPPPFPSRKPVTRDLVQAYFERSAENFDRLYAPERQSALMRWVNGRFRRDIAERFLLTLKLAEETRSQSVLDVGCGSGRYLSALASLGVKRLIGVDLSSAMIDLARKETGECTGAEIDLIQTDFQTWTTTEAFDLLVGMGLFDYADNPLALLTKMRSLTRGAAIASFPSRHWLRTPIRRLRYLFKRCPAYFYGEDEIRTLGNDAGFASTEITKIRGAGMDYVVIFRAGENS